LRDAAEGEEEFYEISGRLFGGLFDDVSDGVGDRGLEGDATGVEACKVYPNELAWLEECAHPAMFAPGAGQMQAHPEISIKPPRAGHSALERQETRHA